MRELGERLLGGGFVSSDLGESLKKQGFSVRKWGNSLAGYLKSYLKEGRLEQN